MSTPKHKASSGDLGKDRLQTTARSELGRAQGELLHLSELALIDVSLMSIANAIEYLPDQIGRKSAPWIDELDNKLGRIARSLETLARPKLPIGTYAIVYGQTDQGGPVTVHAHGEVMAFEAGTLWLNDVFGDDLMPIRVHEGDDSDPDAWRTFASFYSTEVDFSRALHEAFKAATR